MCHRISVRAANSAYPDQTAPKEQSDLGKHCLLRGSRVNIDLSKMEYAMQLAKLPSSHMQTAKA